MSQNKPLIIDGLQYGKWSEKIFSQFQEGGVSAVHVTIAYHETLREMIWNLEEWNYYFRKYPNLIFLGRWGSDIRLAQDSNRTAVFFGFQNPSPIGEDIGLVEIFHTLGIRFIQMSYNNQSLLATGCYELEDHGITRMGREVIREMNRVGIAIDMSHSSERSTMEAIEISECPIVISHANPYKWHPVVRNKSDKVLKALAESEGMLGLSLYPHHLKNGSRCTLQNFAEMVAQTVDLIGIQAVGIGSDLCQDQPDSVVEWMRNGRWTMPCNTSDTTKIKPVFPPQPRWFRDNRDFYKIAKSLRRVGFNSIDVEKILGLNWLRFFERSFNS